MEPFEPPLDPPLLSLSFLPGYLKYDEYNFGYKTADKIDASVMPIHFLYIVEIVHVCYKCCHVHFFIAIKNSISILTLPSVYIENKYMLGTDYTDIAAYINNMVCTARLKIYIC